MSPVNRFLYCSGGRWAVEWISSCFGPRAGCETDLWSALPYFLSCLVGSLLFHGAEVDLGSCHYEIMTNPFKIPAQPRLLCDDGTQGVLEVK